MENAGVIGIGQVGSMELAERLAHGFLRGKAIQGGCFAVPVGNDRIQVLDDDGFPGLFEHLLEFARACLRLPVFGTANYLGFNDAHKNIAHANSVPGRRTNKLGQQSEAREPTETDRCLNHGNLSIRAHSCGPTVGFGGNWPIGGLFVELSGGHRLHGTALRVGKLHCCMPA